MTARQYLDAMEGAMAAAMAARAAPWLTCPKCLAHQRFDISPLGICFLCGADLYGDRFVGFEITLTGED